MKGCEFVNDKIIRAVMSPQPSFGLASIQIEPWEDGITVYNKGEFGIYKEGTPSGRWVLVKVIEPPHKEGDLLTLDDMELVVASVKAERDRELRWCWVFVIGGSNDG